MASAFNTVQVRTIGCPSTRVGWVFLSEEDAPSSTCCFVPSMEMIFVFFFFKKKKTNLYILRTGRVSGARCDKPQLARESKYYICIYRCIRKMERKRDSLRKTCGEERGNYANSRLAYAKQFGPSNSRAVIVRSKKKCRWTAFGSKLITSCPRIRPARL